MNITSLRIAGELSWRVFMYGYGVFSVRRCPLCGEPVSWGERQAGLYACLTVCVPLIPYPQHLIQKHRDYLAAAKKAARPVFYSAFFSAVFAGVLAVYGFHAAAAFPAAVSVTAFVTGWIRRRELISRFRSQ
jgi:hypothetical protein